MSTVRFSRFVLPGWNALRKSQQRLARDYRPIELIYSERLDGLIVTGTEPLADDLRSETYWGALAELIAWAEVATASCRACPAWRHTRPHCSSTASSARRFRPSARVSSSRRSFQGHPLTEGLGPLVHMPHSRLNDLPSASCKKAATPT